MVYLVWAMTENLVIGHNNELPWKIRAEMQYFQQITTSKTVLMGSKTFLSIGKPLKNRHNIIISHNNKKYHNFTSENCIISNDLTKTLRLYQANANQDIYVIGGAKIYQQSWPFADYLLVSIIKQSYKGNVKFPIIDWTNGFQRIKRTDFPEFFADVYQKKG